MMDFWLFKEYCLKELQRIPVIPHFRNKFLWYMIELISLLLNPVAVQ